MLHLNLSEILPDYIVESDSAILLMFGSEIVGTELFGISRALDHLRLNLEFKATEFPVQRNQLFLETGLNVQVPLFLETGEKIKVDTRTGSYISRA